MQSIFNLSFVSLLSQITKKCLNSAFTSVSGDIESSKESITFSPISEVSDGTQHIESTESLMLALNPDLSASSETYAPSNLTPSSKIITDKDESVDVSIECSGSGESDGLKIGYVEAEIVVNLLREARFQVFNSADADLRSKKLLDALIKIVIEEFYTLPEERDRFVELISAKTSIVFLCFLLWILAVSVVLFFGSGVRSSFIDPPPT